MRWLPFNSAQRSDEMGWPKGQPRPKRNEQPASPDSTAEAAAAAAGSGAPGNAARAPEAQSAQPPAQAEQPGRAEQGNAAADGGLGSVLDVINAGGLLSGFQPAGAGAPPLGDELGDQAAVAKLPRTQPRRPVPPLEEFITSCEREKLDAGVVLVAMKHPAITEARHREGTYSGFSMEPGALPWARWSDGSAISTAE
jgi:hypothetical protein